MALNTFAVHDSLMVEMKSRKRSFGKRGFSSPLKYSFSTPATELISCSFWSSTKGSSPEEEYLCLQWWHLMRGKNGLSCLSICEVKQGMYCLTSLKWVFNIIDFHLWPRHAKNALLLQAWKKYNPEFRDSELHQLTLSPNLNASSMRAHWKHITQSRKCNLVIKGDAYFSMRGPLSEVAAYVFS